MAGILFCLLIIGILSVYAAFNYFKVGINRNAPETKRAAAKGNAVRFLILGLISTAAACIFLFFSL